VYEEYHQEGDHEEEVNVLKVVEASDETEVADVLDGDTKDETDQLLVEEEDTPLRKDADQGVYPSDITQDLEGW
jgi:hypothetical protein